MNRSATTESNRNSEIELPTGSTTITQKFLEACVLNADHKELEEHLVSKPVQQSDLDSCLLLGLRIVQRKERELSHVAQALTLLLQSGAKWNSDALLDEQRTLYHIIAGSRGDHHELLDLMITSSPQTIIDIQDWIGHTALLHAVQNANINCLKCLIAKGADVHILKDIQKSSAIIEAIRMLRRNIKYTSVNEEIFDLLLEKSSFECYMSFITVAAHYRSVYCIKKLIKKGVNPNVIGPDQRYVWPRIARVGNVELLKNTA